MDKLKFDIQIKDVKQINPLFSECKIYILYTGKNRNNSSLLKDIVDNAIYSLFNIPIIGEYNETLEDFRGHGGKIEISDEGIKFIQTTKPYGLIPESSVVEWEDVVEEDGTIRQYLTCTAYLWTGRYPEALQAIENTHPQSMEIDQVVGKFSKEGVYEIDSFVFSALTILGQDITPCFESASITNYNFNKDEFKHQFSQMIEELKFALNSSKETNFNKEGGNELREEITALLQKYSLTQEQILEKDSELNFEEISVEDLEAKLIEFTKVEEVVEPEVESNPTTDFTEDNIENALNNPESEPETNFSLTATQLVEEIRKVLMTRVVVAKDWWGDSYEAQEFYYRDIKDDLVIVIDNEWINYYGIPLTTNEDTVILDFENKIPYMADWRPKVEGDASFSFEIFEIMKERALARTVEIQSVDTTEFTTKIESLEKEVQELTEFKLDIQKQEKLDLVDKFTELTDEEKAVFIENIDTYSLEDLEIKLFAEIGKKKINYTVETVKPTNLIFSIPKTTGGDAPAWVEMVEQYKAKNNK